MPAQLQVVGAPAPTTFRTVSATLNMHGSFDAKFYLTGGNIVMVRVVEIINDAFIGTSQGRDVLIPFAGYAMMEIL